MLQRKMTEAAGSSKMLIPIYQIIQSYPRRYYEGHALAQAVNHWPLNVESQVDPMPVHVGFVMNEVAKDFLQRPQSSCLNNIPPVLQTHISFTCDLFYTTVANECC